MHYLDATPLLKLRTHFDLCYVCSGQELSDVPDQTHSNTHAPPLYLTAVSAAERVCFRTSTPCVWTPVAATVHAEGGAVFLLVRLFHKQIQNFLE